MNDFINANAFALANAFFLLSITVAAIAFGYELRKGRS